MVRHIVTFTLKADSPEQKRQDAVKMKAMLEALPQIIPGIIKLVVRIDLLPTSSVDVVLDSWFESTEALAAYQVHPEHLRVGEFVTLIRKDRACIDFMEDGAH